jgi:hypothetical protein
MDRHDLAKRNFYNVFNIPESKEMYTKGIICYKGALEAKERMLTVMVNK